MGIFKRLSDLLKANINDLISKAEDPEKMLNQMIIDMNEHLIETKKGVASAIADEKRLERQIKENQAKNPSSLKLRNKRPADNMDRIIR